MTAKQPSWHHFPIQYHRCSCIALIELYRSYLDHVRRSTIAILLIVSEIEAVGGRDADLTYMRVAEDIAARIGSGEVCRS